MSQNAITLTDPVFVENPYKVYDTWRGTTPVHEVSAGVFLLTRYRDASKALMDPRLSNRPAPFALLHARNRESFVGADIAQNLIAFRDPPEVAASRKKLSSEFTLYAKTCSELLQTAADESLASVPTHGDIEFCTEVAIPYAVHTMCDLFGFPRLDAARLKSWSTEFFYLFHAIPDRETLVRVNDSLSAFRTYTQEIVADRRTAPGNDLISHLVKANHGTLEDAALVDNIMLMAVDGVENVWAGIANALHLLIHNTAEARAFLEAGGTWAAIADECLRLESPGQYQGRIATEEMEIGGTRVRRYSVVLVGFAAANRDPDVFEDPGTFRPGRKGPRNLAFGLGPHACIGRILVRNQMASVLKALWPLIPRLHCAADRPEWDARAGHRWLRALPLSLSPKDQPAV